ncbi:MAG: MerR family transcriptional regulator [Gemmatimonadota bacterium]|nr:MerR family transcriptional regulator [Gemmatimonadota bacterium]
MTALSAPVPSTAPRYPIRVVARRVGVSEMTLRAWERRYGAVAPARSDGGHRLFSEADVERLTLLRALTGQGIAISTLATLTMPALRRLAPTPVAEPAPKAVGRVARAPSSRDKELATCARAVVALDGERLHQVLMRLVLERGPLSFIEDVASPLCAWIGDEWSQDRLTEAQEHAASDVLRRVLDFTLHTLRRDRRARHVVLTTLAGERHEFGSMMAGIVAAFHGWSCSCLSPDLPAAAIGAAVIRLKARLVAVSIVAPPAAARAARELVALRRIVGRQVAIVVGGPCAAAVDHVLHEARATRIGSLDEWRAFLARQ